MEAVEAGKVGGNVAAGRLHHRRHRNAVAVVFDIKQHRQLLRRRNGQRRPEAVGGDRRVAAEDDAEHHQGEKLLGIHVW